jgi:hypothetical protein
VRVERAYDFGNSESSASAESSDLSSTDLSNKYSVNFIKCPHKWCYCTAERRSSAQKNLMSHRLCDLVLKEPQKQADHIIGLCDILISHIYIQKRTFVFYFFPNKYEKNVKGGLHASQDLPYKLILPLKAYVMKG